MVADLKRSVEKCGVNGLDGTESRQRDRRDDGNRFEHEPNTIPQIVREAGQSDFVYACHLRLVVVEVPPVTDRFYVQFVRAVVVLPPFDEDAVITDT